MIEHTNKNSIADTEETSDFSSVSKKNTHKKGSLKKEIKERKKARKKEENKYGARSASLINILLCGTVFFGVSVGMVVLERPTVSEMENRNLATLPSFSWDSFFKGKYTAGVSEYYNDTVPMRALWKDCNAKFKTLYGKQSEVTLYGNITVNKDPEPTTEAPTTTTVTTALNAETNPNATVTTQVTTLATEAPTEATTEAEEEQGELSNNILIYKNRGIMLFGGGYSSGEVYASYVNAYKQDLGENVNVYSMVVPTSCSFYTPDDYQYLIASEADNINHINEFLSGVTPVDAYSALDAHKDEAIYSRTDHHWQQLGAWYAAQEFAKTADVPFLPLRKYTKNVLEGYVGTLYGYSGDAKLKDNPEDFVYYTPPLNFSTTYYTTDFTSPHSGNLLLDPTNLATVSWYLVFMGGDERVTRIDTEMTNGRTLCIIKDSYGNALVPCLTGSFQHIYVVDMRYFSRNIIGFLQEIGATDVLFAMNTFSAMGGNYRKLETLRMQGQRPVTAAEEPTEAPTAAPTEATAPATAATEAPTAAPTEPPVVETTAETPPQ